MKIAAWDCLALLIMGNTHLCMHPGSWSWENHTGSKGASDITIDLVSYFLNAQDPSFWFHMFWWSGIISFIVVSSAIFNSHSVISNSDSH